MQTPLNRKRSPRMPWLCGVALVFVLAACGGGGGGNSTGGSPGSGGGPGTGASIVLEGVAATGAPMPGATISVLDATGADCGSTTAGIADGQFSDFTLTCASPTLPLFVQAAGVDAAGKPTVLHSLVSTVTTGAGPGNRVNITSLTNAIVALLVGGEPTSAFLAGKASASGSAAVRANRWNLLGSSAARSAASAFIKTVIAANLNDARQGSVNLVTHFNDVNFSASKTGMDAVMEELDIQFSTVTGGIEVMQLSNRLLPPCDPTVGACNASTPVNPGSPEVVVSLPGAKASLTAPTPTVSTANDILSSPRKNTSSTTTIMANVAGLESLRNTIKDNLTSQATSNSFLALEISAGKPVFASTFGYFDGQDASGVARTLAGYGTSDYLMSSFSIQGCLDTVVAATPRCSQIKIGALIRDRAGSIQSVFENVVNYVSTTSSWSLSGNGRVTPWSLFPAAWYYLNGDGSPMTSAASGANPARGIQVVIRALDALSPLIADLTAPNSSAHFYSCVTPAGYSLCLQNTSGNGYETGDLVLDQILTSGTSPLAGTDTRRGTRFQISTTGLSSEVNASVLLADQPSVTDLTAYPRPDGLSATSRLFQADISGGTTISWSNWAAAHPGMRMVEVRAVITQPAPQAPSKQVFTILPLAPTHLTIPATAVPGSPVEYALWLIAEDAQGRRYISKIVADS